MHSTNKSTIYLMFVLLVFALLPPNPSAAQQPGPVFTLDRDRNNLTTSATIYQSVIISLTRSSNVIESATRPSPFSSYQFSTLLQPGDQITLRAGATVLYDAEIIPTNLIVDMANGQISGQSFPGQLVETTFHTFVAVATDTFNKCWDKGGDYPYNFTLQTTAMPDGSFNLTYPVGLRPGDMGSLTIYDVAGNKQIQTFNTGDIIALNIQRRGLEGQFFSSVPNLPSVNITINNPDGTLLWSTSVNYSTLYNSQFYLYVPQTVPLLPGEIIKVTDGVKTKQMVIPKITLDQLLGSQAVTGRVEIPGSNIAPSGYMVMGWYEFQLIRQVDHCLERQVTQGEINVPFNIEPFTALDEFYLTYEDGNGNFISNGYVVNSLIVTKDRPDPAYGIFGVSLELQNTAFNLDHYRAGQVIGSYSGITDTWGNNHIQTGPDIIAEEGDWVVVSVGGETLIDLVVPKLSAVIDTLNNQVTGQVTSQDPDAVPLQVNLQRLNGAHQGITRKSQFASNLDGTFIIQPQAGEIWETAYEQPVRPFQMDDCTQISSLYSQVPGGHVIVWSGPAPANVNMDAYEPDNTSPTARPYIGPQRHTMLTGSDQDWVSFEITPANAGKPITFTTQDMGWGMELGLTVYSMNASLPSPLTYSRLSEPSKLSFSYTFSTPGIYSVKIQAPLNTSYIYGGCDSAYTLSIQSPEPLRSSTHLRLIGSLPVPIYPGQMVTLQFDLGPGLPSDIAPTGTLTISDSLAGGEPICQSTVTGSIVDCTFAFSSAGRHTLTASYSGGSLYEPSTSAEISWVVSQFNTSTELSIAPQLPVSGQPVVLTARVDTQSTGSVVTGGSVTFYDGDTILGDPVPLANGTAHLDLGGLSVGTHTITAVYSGDLNFTGSQSPGVELTIESKDYSCFLPIVMR